MDSEHVAHPNITFVTKPVFYLSTLRYCSPAKVQDLGFRRHVIFSDNVWTESAGVRPWRATRSTESKDGRRTLDQQHSSHAKRRQLPES